METINRDTSVSLLDYMEKKFGPQAKKMALEGSGPLSQAGRAVVTQGEDLTKILVRC